MEYDYDQDKREGHMTTQRRPVPPVRPSPPTGINNQDTEADDFRGARMSSGPVQQIPSNWAEGKGTDKVTFSNFKELCYKYVHEELAYCSVFMNFGMCVAFLGPTLLDLGCQTSTDDKAMSWVFFAQLLCSLIGSILAGIFAKRFDNNLMLTIATINLPILMFIIPFCKALPQLGLVLAIMGLNMGCIDCLANLQMIKTFEENVSPFLQALHFCYGLGAFISPMIAEPFLLNEDCSPFIEKVEGTTISPSVQTNVTLPANTLEEAQEMTRVRYAFWILCILQLPVIFIMGSLLLRMRLRGKHSGHQQLSGSESDMSISTKEMERKDYENIDKKKVWAIPGSNFLQNQAEYFSTTTNLVIAITVATAVMCFMYDGLQSAYGGYVYSFAVKSIADLNKTEGAYLNALFWGMFALGRLLSIFFATRFTPAFMLLCNITGCFFSMLLMLTLRHDHGALYLGTCIFGLSLSSVTPTTLSLAEQFIDVTPSVTTFVVVVAATGEMIFPVIVGNISVSQGPVSFLVFNFTVSFLSLFIFGFLWYFGRQTPKQKATAPSSFIWTRLCCLHLQAPEASDQLMDPRQNKFYSSEGKTDASHNFELSQRGHNGHSYDG